MGFCSISTDNTLCHIASPMTLTPDVVTLGSFPRMCHVINQVSFGPAQGPIVEEEAAEQAAPQEDGEKHLSLRKNLPLPQEAVVEPRPLANPETAAGPAMPPPPYTANPKPAEQEGFWQVKKLEGRETEAIAERVRAYHPGP